MQIGREEGVSRQTISKQLASTDARQIIVALTNREIDRISILFSQLLQANRRGLGGRGRAGLGIRRGGAAFLRGNDAASVAYFRERRFTGGIGPNYHGGTCNL